MPESPIKELNDDFIEKMDQSLRPAMTNWGHPQFNAYFPSVLSNSAVYGTIFDSFFQINQKQPSQASFQKLESKLLEAVRHHWNLPEVFSPKKDGAGALMSSIGNCSTIAIHLAKLDKINSLGIEQYSSPEANQLKQKFTSYFYDVAHSHAEKAINFNDIKHGRQIDCLYDKASNTFMHNYEELERQVKFDIEKGQIPLAAFGVIGSTPTGSSDDQKIFAQICKKYNMTSIVDAAWAGSYTICPEYTDCIEGLELCDFYFSNFSKAGGSGMETSIMYLQNQSQYLNLLRKNKSIEVHEENWLNDLRLGDYTKIGQMKLHFQLQNEGIEGLQSHFRRSVELTDYIQNLISQDDRLEIIPKRQLSLMGFRLKAYNGDQSERDRRNQLLLEKLNEDGRLFCVAGKCAGEYFIRISVPSNGQESDYDFMMNRIIEVCNQQNLF